MKTLFYAAILILILASGVVVYKGNYSLSTRKVSAPQYGDFVCWASPSKEILEKCQTCSGSGVYAWHRVKRVAKRNAMNFCSKNYGKGSCHLEYCEKLRRR